MPLFWGNKGGTHRAGGGDDSNNDPDEWEDCDECSGTKSVPSGKLDDKGRLILKPCISCNATGRQKKPKK